MRRTTRSRRKKTQLADISLTPLVDTALTLLIIFMVTASTLQNAIQVTLPKGQAKENMSVQQELVVYIDKDGKFFFGQQQVDIETLIAKIKKAVGLEKEKTVFVKADQEVSYGTVLELVDHIKVVGGVKYVALATQQRSQKETVSSA